MTGASRFDFASLTKPFVATLALVLEGAGELPLSLKLGDLWEGARRELARKTLEDLLRQRAGMAAWVPLGLLCVSSKDVEQLLVRGDLPVARSETYSDLSYLLWALSAERVLGRPLWPILRERVIEPLGLASVGPAPGDQPDVVQSWMDGGKESELAALQGWQLPVAPPPEIGSPQDGNARFLRFLGQEVPGHAGLFGDAFDLYRLGQEWLRPQKLLDPAAVARALNGGRSYALGWRRRAARGSAGPMFSRRAFGQTGFAGGSLWMDPESDRIRVLLASRRDPLADFNAWRRRFHALG